MQKVTVSPHHSHFGSSFNVKAAATAAATVAAAVARSLTKTDIIVITLNTVVTEIH